jgi:CRISPR-associated protein Cas2
MEYIICYDLTDDRRRDRLANALLDYGQRIQESVFLAHLDEELYARMLDRVARLIDEVEDCVHVFTLCGNCEGKTRVFGRGEMPADRPFVII